MKASARPAISRFSTQFLLACVFLILVMAFISLKTLALIILLLNFKAPPKFWHIRLFRYAFRIAFYRKFLGRNTLRALPLPKKPSDALFRTITHTRRNLLDDSDIFWHMSNSSYNKVFDFIRMDLLCQVFPDIIYDTKKLGIKVAFGGSSVVFIKEIPIFGKYNLHARVISWSPQGKWLYLQGVFTLPVTAKARDKRRPQIVVNNSDSDAGFVSGTSTPTLSGDRAPSTTLSGETICAVIYGRYVFKRRSRETVPVDEVLRVCGYIGDDEIEEKRVEGWEYVEGLEHVWDKTPQTRNKRVS